MVARNPIGYLGGLIILSPDKKNHKKKLYVRLYTSYYGYGTWTNRMHVSLLSESLFSTGFDPRTFRSLGEISTATAAWVPGIQVLVPYIYLSDSSEGA